MSQVHEGGCLCGAVRYRVTGEPVRTSVCHCRKCQARTGSAFGIGAYFREADVELRGALTTYEYRSDETRRWLRTQFCPRCSTTHSCLERVQTWRWQSSQRGSSKDPPASARRPVSASAVQVTVVPQRGQNCVRSQRRVSSERYS